MLSKGLFTVENHHVCSTLDLVVSVNGSNGATWVKQIHETIYPGNGFGTRAPQGCGGGSLTFTAREDMKVFDGCADDLFAEQNK